MTEPARNHCQYHGWYDCNPCPKCEKDYPIPNKAVDVPRLVRQIELMGEVVDAALCIRHWHDSGKEGMVVSKEHVFKLWEALNNLEAHNSHDEQH